MPNLSSIPNVAPIAPDRWQAHRNQSPDWSRCCHLRLNGARCTMPSLRGKTLCYDHDRRERRERFKPHLPELFPTAPLLSFAYMEDHASILNNINSIADAFARHAIDYRQVGPLTRLMQTALKTLRQMHVIEKEVAAEDSVRDVSYDEYHQGHAIDEPVTGPASPETPNPESAIPASTESASAHPANPPTAASGTAGSAESPDGSLDAETSEVQEPCASHAETELGEAERSEIVDPGLDQLGISDPPDQESLTLRACAETAAATHPTLSSRCVNRSLIAYSQTLKRKESPTPLFSTLTEKKKISSLLSSTYGNEKQGQTPTEDSGNSHLCH
jgi:hypothetical protein